MNLKNLVRKLTDLEDALQIFSYENLTTTEAQELKDSLGVFKQYLEAKLQQENVKASKEAAKTVQKINEDIGPRTSKTEDCPGVDRLADSVLTESCRFSEYLKDSPLTNEQLEYINAILSSADIRTRVSNDANESAIDGFNKTSDKINTNNLLKNKSMDTSHKTTGQLVQSSQTANGKPAQIDLSPVLEDCLGKTDLLYELIRLYRQNALEFIGQVRLHLQNLDFEGIKFAAHKLKSGLKMMQTLELLVIVEQIESVSKTDQDLKHLNFLFDCFVKEYPIVERAIDMEFKKLKQKTDG